MDWAQWIAIPSGSPEMPTERLNEPAHLAPQEGPEGLKSQGPTLSAPRPPPPSPPRPAEQTLWFHPGFLHSAFLTNL